MTQTDRSGHRATLRRKDMIVFEQRLVDSMARLISFSGHSVHFPRSGTKNEAAWISREKKLLLPLPGEGDSDLCLFVARGEEAKPPSGFLPLWPGMAALVADNLLQYKRSICDPVTGLFTRQYLLDRMEREIETLRDPIRSPSLPSGKDGGSAEKKEQPQRSPVRGSGEGMVQGAAEAARRAGLACLVVRLAALRDVVREFGYQFADKLMVALADALTNICPEQALAARTGDSEFAVLLPASAPRACRQLAADIVQALRQTSVVHPLRREQVGISPSVGYTFYPQDVAGSLFVRPGAEQARLVLRKARLAAAVAEEGLPLMPGRVDMEGVMGFGRILAEGGWVTEALPLSRVMVSLGSNMHAREGQRFSVWSTRYPASGGLERGQLSQAPLYKGEVVLMEVYPDCSQAEIIHLGEPGWNIEPGDHLMLLADEKGSLARGRDGEPKQDAETGLLRHGDFLARWAEERDKTDAFALALIRLSAPDKDALFTDERDDGRDNGDGRLPSTAAMEDAEGMEAPESVNGRLGQPDNGEGHPGRFMAEAASLFLEEFGSSILGGRYGLNSLIFYHPMSAADDAESLKQRYEKLARELADRLKMNTAVGIAAHPYLDFRKADALENSRKALEYALLLPGPHVGILDSLALNISADKRFSQGDTFGAIKEYELALLADEKNGMAWNSLGICLAGLSRHAEAERHFSRALDCDPEDAMALYNLGYVHQSRGSAEEARTHYEACLKIDPDHLYSLVRLGQLAENAGDPAKARELYEQAARLPGGKSLTYRHFARLCISEDNKDEAREHLHEALLHDPQDAVAMALLAGLYLDGGEDPEMAASLARQSVSLRPGLKSGWLALSRALEQCGNGRDADEARIKAGSV